MIAVRPGGRAPRRGNVSVLVAISLIAVVAMTALSVDGGLLQMHRRKAQAAADASAMAAACVLYQGWPAYVAGQDLPTAAAKTAALDTADANGFPQKAGETEVSVSVPPATGLYAGKPGFAEVTVTVYQRRYFSAIFDKTPIPVRARAVSKASWDNYRPGVLILDYTGKATLNAQGNGAFTAVEAPVIVNSNNSAALTTSGNGYISAKSFHLTGGTALGGNGALQATSGLIETGVHPTPDPLAYLPVPSVPANGTMTTTSLGQGNKLYTLTPGRYTNLPTFNVGDVVVLKQASASANPSDPLTAGVYYIDGGGFKSTGATVRMDPTTTGGVLIYNNPASSAQSEKIQITGNSAGSVNLGPLESGPYSGLSLWQNRQATNEMLIEGNGQFKLEGTFYAASAMLKINGNGGAYTGSNGELIQGSAVGSQFVTKELSLGGNGNIHIIYNKNKVAKERVLTLVE